MRVFLATLFLDATSWSWKQSMGPDSTEGVKLTWSLTYLKEI